MSDEAERKQVEEALRESELLQRQLVDSNPEAMALVDAGGAILAANEAMASRLGRSADRLAGASLVDLLPEEVRPEYRQRLEQGIRSGQRLRFEEQREGRTFETCVQPLADSRGAVTRLAVLSLDVTDERQAARDRLQMELRIQHTQKLESLGILAGGIAHDFNNILMAILGNVDLALQDLSGNASVRENLVDIERAARRAAELCRQMLAYSGKGPFVFQTLDLSELIRDMEHMLSASVANKKVLLRFDLSRPLASIEADATQLRQVVMNLVINGAESVSGSGAVSVSTGVTEGAAAAAEGGWIQEPEAGKRYVSLEVSDTGCGIAPETLDRIFDPFFTTKFTGRGLGLAAVLGIVRGHHGAIRVSSRPGVGTAFRLLFPSVEHRPELQVADPRGGNPWRGSGTVLVVDDEETARVLTSRMLARLGFKTLLAADGHQALEVFRQQPREIVCVILDLTMPRMDGEEAFRELRRLDESVRIILTSGYSEQDATQRFGRCELAGFLQKPFRLEDLARRLRDTLGP